MRKIGLILCLCTTVVWGQIRTGSILFTMYNSDGEDHFAFVSLDVLSKGTTIYVTDKGWNLKSDSLSTNEGTLEITFNNDFEQGASFLCKPTKDSIFGISNNYQSKIKSTGSFSLSSSGDQLFIYEKINGKIHFISGLNADNSQLNSDGWQDVNNSTSTSNKPTELQNGINSISLFYPNKTEKDNLKYNGPTSGTKEQLQQLLCDIQNWEFDPTDNTPFNAPIQFEIKSNINAIIETENSYLQFFPNPCTSEIYSDEEVEKIQILNLDGEMVLSQNKFPVNVSHLMAGVYIIQCIKSNGKVENQELIKK